jgi:hypothetical protein
MCRRSAHLVLPPLVLSVKTGKARERTHGPSATLLCALCALCAVCAGGVVRRAVLLAAAPWKENEDWESAAEVKSQGLKPLAERTKCPQALR